MHRLILFNYERFADVPFGGSQLYNEFNRSSSSLKHLGSFGAQEKQVHRRITIQGGLVQDNEREKFDVKFSDMRILSSWEEIELAPEKHALETATWIYLFP